MLPALAQHAPNDKPGGVYYQELPVLLLAEVQAQQRQLYNQAQASKRQQRHLRNDAQTLQHQQRELDQLTKDLRSLRRRLPNHH